MKKSSVIGIYRWILLPDVVDPLTSGSGSIELMWAECHTVLAWAGEGSLQTGCNHFSTVMVPVGFLNPCSSLVYIKTSTQCGDPQEVRIWAGVSQTKMKIEHHCVFVELRLYFLLFMAVNSGSRVCFSHLLYVTYTVYLSLSAALYSLHSVWTLFEC